MLTSIFIVFAYLLGSLNFAIILCKATGVPDPRQEGSKNPGATNVLRLGGKKLAAFVILGDIFKGVVPVLLAKVCGIENTALSVVALAAVLGHIYPVFFKFEGGKGIATMLGAILALSFSVGLVLVITWVLIASLSRFSSLASIISAILLPLYLLFFSEPYYVLPMLILSAIILIRHRNNIQRLIKGTEPKLGKKSA
jgi:glycerol-3-phosphate acyltransferase PlsY